jgi:hypothetical protein
MANPSLRYAYPPKRPLWLGIISVSLGLIGLALSFLLPYMIVVNLAGFICGFVALLRPSGRRGYGLLFALCGTGLCLIGIAISAPLRPGWCVYPWPGAEP